MALVCRCRCFFTNPEFLWTQGRWTFVCTRDLHNTKRKKSLEVAVPEENRPLQTEAKTPFDVVIPKKIPRDDLTILKALASTVEKDWRGPEYGILDDPNLIPYASRHREIVIRSKASGRKAARFVMSRSHVKQHVEFRPMHDDTVITPPAFNPPRVYRFEQNTVHGLRERIDKRRVRDAAKSYDTTVRKLRKKGSDIPADLAKDFFELYCFAGGRALPQPLLDEDAMLSHFSDIKKPLKPWRKTNKAEDIFKRTDNPDTAMYEAVIRGKARHGDYSGVEELYNKMKEQGVPVSVEIFNAVLQTCTNRETSNDRILEILKEMRNSDVQPNQRTFQEAIIKSGGNFMLKLIREMVAMGLEPTLGIYERLLSFSYSPRVRNKDPKFLLEVLDHMEGKSYDFKSVPDIFFFRQASKLAVNLRSLDAAVKLYWVLKHGNNFKLLKKKDEPLVLKNLFLVYLRHGELKYAMEIYDDIVPYHGGLRDTDYEEILMAIESQEEFQYLPKIWADIRLQQLYSISNIETLLDMCSKLEFDQKWLKREIVDLVLGIVKNYKTDMQYKEFMLGHYKKVIRNNVVTGFQITPTMLDRIIQTLLNAGNFEQAWDTFNVYLKIRVELNGVMRRSALGKLLDACIKEQDNVKAIKVLRTFKESQYFKIQPEAKRLTAGLELTPEQKAEVEMLLQSK